MTVARIVKAKDLLEETIDWGIVGVIDQETKNGGCQNKKVVILPKKTLKMIFLQETKS